MSRPFYAAQGNDADSGSMPLPLRLVLLLSAGLLLFGLSRMRDRPKLDGHVVFTSFAESKEAAADGVALSPAETKDVDEAKQIVREVLGVTNLLVGNLDMVHVRRQRQFIEVRTADQTIPVDSAISARPPVVFVSPRLFQRETTSSALAATLVVEVTHILDPDVIRLFNSGDPAERDKLDRKITTAGLEAGIDFLNKLEDLSGHEEWKRGAAIIRTRYEELLGRTHEK